MGRLSCISFCCTEYKNKENEEDMLYSVSFGAAVDAVRVAAVLLSALVALEVVRWVQEVVEVVDVSLVQWWDDNVGHNGVPDGGEDMWDIAGSVADGLMG